LATTLSAFLVKERADWSGLPIELDLLAKGHLIIYNDIKGIALFVT
jgi:hypothetical protein